LSILDSPPELEFDSIAELARNLSGAQVALVSLVAEERLWFKARIGLDISETPRDGAFCAHAILDDGVLCVSDATSDSRFRANPLVTASPHVRSYIGAPIVVRGQRLGTVCALSSTPRSFDEAIRQQFRHLAVIIAERLVLRHRTSFITGLTKTTSDAVIATDKDQNITYWGGGAERMFGFTSDEALQLKLDALMPERVKAAHNAGFERFRKTEQSRMVGRSVELPAQHRSGAEFPIDLNVTIWREGESMMIGGIVRDATERRSLAEARIVNEAQSRFLANMSHEVRTPLNGVLGIAQVLEASGLSEAQRSMVEIIKDSAGSLNTLLSDILLSARLESGETVVHSDEFEVGRTISKAVALHHAAATTKGLQLVWDQLDSEAWVIGDPVKSESDNR
jgi:PAS domain S-box-containing protein